MLSTILVVILKNVWWLILSHQDQLHAFAQKGLCLVAMESAHKVWGDIIYCILYTIQPSWSKVDLIFQTLLPVQVRPQCTVNEDCPYSDICQLGNCIDACRATKCGTNAVCASSNHRAECSCIHGFKGDPFTACRPRKMNKMISIINYKSFLLGTLGHDCMFFQRPRQLSLAWMWVVQPMMNVLTILHVKTDSV